MSKVPARWERVKRAVEIRNDIYDAGIKSHSKTLIIGNGDVLDIEDGRECEESGADGAMLDDSFGNPWLSPAWLLKTRRSNKGSSGAGLSERRWISQ
jgi:tRNA-dihydrouridine synthase